MTIAGSTGFGRSIQVSRLTVSRTALPCRLQATDSSRARGESGESGVGAGDGIRGPEYQAVGLRLAELHFLAKRTVRADRLHGGLFRRGAVAASGAGDGSRRPEYQSPVHFVYRLHWGMHTVPSGFAELFA